jgi:tetratricopeptide (TPR) repeat protein
MKNIPFILFALFIISCTKSQESLLAEIQVFEKSEKTGTQEGLEELSKLHKYYGLKYSDTKANSYLYAAAQYYFYENDTTESIDLLSEYITRDDSSDRYRNAAINLAIMHAREHQYDKSQDLINEILDKNLPTPAQWQDIIKLYQNKISDATTILQPKDFENLTMGYTAVGRFSDAVRTLDNAIVKWPKFENRNNLIYRAGFIAWEYLQDTKLAEKYYTQFLNEYPNNEKASEVKEILNSGMLEMSDEAILNMLKGK